MTGPFLAAAVAVMALAAPRPAGTQEMYAVFVGINDYMAYEDEPGGDLEGAEQDALLMREVLVERWGLAEENTLTLLSLEATKEAIHESITGWLAERAGPGDLAIFYFAGHGAQVYDLDGDEPDGLDETLAPTDILPLSSANDIRDDEFRQWLLSVGSDVVVILDSCHSGTATRGGTMRTRSLDRPLPPEGGREPERVRQQYDPESMADGSTTILELSAAGPNQSAMEGDFRLTDRDGTEARGAFTYHLVRELWRASPGASYEDLLSNLVSSLKADQFMQDPQLTGSGGRALFRSVQSKAGPALVLPGSTRSQAALTASVRILSRSGRDVVLSGGDVAGATVGSRFRTASGGVVEVTSIQFSESRGVVIDGDAAVGERASLTSIALPAVRVLVDASALPDSTRSTLRAGLARFAGIDLAQGGSAASDLYLVPAESGPGTEVLGRDGQVRSVVPDSAGSSGWYRGTLQALDREWVARAMAALANPARPFAIDIAVTREDGRGGAIAATVTVTSSAAGYLTLLALAPDGTLTTLTPLGGTDRLKADDPMALALGAHVNPMVGPGRGFLLAVVTSAKLDIGSPAAAARPRDPIVLLRLALEEVATRIDSASSWNSRLLVF